MQLFCQGTLKSVQLISLVHSLLYAHSSRDRSLDIALINTWSSLYYPSHSHPSYVPVCTLSCCIISASSNQRSTQIFTLLSRESVILTLRWQLKQFTGQSNYPGKNLPKLYSYQYGLGTDTDAQYGLLDVYLTSLCQKQDDNTLFLLVIIACWFSRSNTLVQMCTRTCML